MIPDSPHQWKGRVNETGEQKGTRERKIGKQQEDMQFDWQARIWLFGRLSSLPGKHFHLYLRGDIFTRYFRGWYVCQILDASVIWCVPFITKPCLLYLTSWELQVKTREVKCLRFLHWLMCLEFLDAGLTGPGCTFVLYVCWPTLPMLRSSSLPSAPPLPLFLLFNCPFLCSSFSPHSVISLSLSWLFSLTQLHGWKFNKLWPALHSYARDNRG